MTMTPAQMLNAALDGKLDLDANTIEGEEVKQPQAEETKPTDDAASDEAKAQQGAQADDKPKAQEDEPEGAPIASKSGEYTIPYDKLKEAREQRDQLKTKVSELEAQLEKLTSEQQANLAKAQESAQARADAGQTETKADKNLEAAQVAIDKGVDISVFGSFSDEDIAKGLKTLADHAGTIARDTLREELKAELKAELEKEFAPIRKREADSAEARHRNAVTAAHADAAEVMESAEFDKWVKAQPSYVQASIQHTLDKGSAEQVIEVFDTFKAQAGQNKPAEKQVQLPEAERRVPRSLSEIAGAAPVDETQQVLAMAGNPAELMNRLGSMSREQIDALLDRAAV